MMHSTLLRLLIICAAGMLSLSLSAQKIPYKFGKVSAKEFAESPLKNDTAAVAVFLYKTGETDYTYDNGMFYTRSTYTSRIKVLKEEGKRYADVSLPYYIFGQADIVLRERINRLKAASYNLVNGKVEKTEMEKSYVFEEKVSDDIQLLKFSVPNVQVGSIIEYQYTVESNYPLYLRDLDIQEEVPVLFAQYDVLIPEYFRFRPTGNGRGVQQKQTQEIQSFHIMQNGQMLNADAQSFRYLFTAKNLPALKEEPSIWCKEDYRTSIQFEFKKLDFPYAIPREIAQTWGAIMGALDRHDSFGRFLRMKNPLKEETAQWLAAHADEPVVEKARGLFGLLRSHIRWNGSYRLFGTNPSKSLSDTRSGSNADINFIYLAMLRDAGITCAPILIRNRKEGRLPLYYPSVNKISTFVAGFFDEEQAVHCADASVEYGDIDILPPELLPETAVLLHYEGTPPMTRFVNLSELGRHYTTHQLSMALTDDGMVSGTCLSSYRGQDARARKEKVAEATDSTAFVGVHPDLTDIVITEREADDPKRLGQEYDETLQFVCKPLTNGEMVYINPLMFFEEHDNPFKSPTRQLPVELHYKKRLQIMARCQIPSCYTVVELPQSLRLRLPDNSLRMTYSATQEGDEVVVNFIVNVSKTYFEAERYEELKNFMAGTIEANQFQIVLKRNT